MPDILIHHNGPFDIAIGKHRRETSWKNKEWLWSDLVKRVSVTHTTAETLGEYVSAKKTRQDEIKDVGGFVGGYLSGGKRGKSTVLHRQLITLDIDHADPGIYDDFVMLYDCAGAAYSTHKHTPEHPRLRLILPLDRPVMPDEYIAISRRIAGNLGIENFDHTTFEPSRLMYWPSTSKGAEYFFEYQDGPWLSADEVLATYHDWRDSSEWPVSERFSGLVNSAIKKQGDPLEKPGVIGAFCRTFNVHEAIEEFLSDVYTACDVDDRYTFAGGSTSGGLVVYDDKFTYSHHGTDPTSGKLCNAFDLVRMHKYTDRDDDVADGTPSNKLPSYVAMVDFASSVPRVRKQLGSERLSSAIADFEAAMEDSDGAPEELNTDWIATLDVDRKGNYYSTLDNIVIILENDPLLKGRIALNEFEQREGVTKNLPWRKVTGGSNYLSDRDVSNLKHYLEKTYGISSAPKVEDALKVVLERNRYHPIKDYLNAQKWDRLSRIDTLLVDYLGAVDNEYTRAITRKVLAAAVSRVYCPGIKFDYMMVFVGKQGLKKSMLIDKLGRDWFSDSFTTVQGKDAYEQVQGAWLIEVAELAGLKKAEIEQVKHFVSKRKDRYRVAYGRRVEEFLRQCVFFGTTNNRDFLRDPTGNRRFWPVDVHETTPAKDIAQDLNEYEIGQIWAEAVSLYRAGEPLYLSAELEQLAYNVQADHVEVDERAGLIQRYLDTKLPLNWNEMGIFERRAYLAGGDELQPLGTVMRVKACAAEIWCECLGGKQETMNRFNTKDIHDIMRTLPGWQLSKSKQRFSGYGVQISYNRLNDGVASTSEFVATLPDFVASN